jgi:hypothetical protein
MLLYLGLPYNTGAYKFLQPKTNPSQNEDVTTASFNFLIDRRTFSDVKYHPDLGQIGNNNYDYTFGISLCVTLAPLVF